MMNIREAQMFLTEASGRRTFKVKGLEFRTLDDCVEIKSPISLEIAREMKAQCSELRFGLQREENPEDVATSNEFRKVCVEIRKQLKTIDAYFSDKFLEQEERELRKRLINYYDDAARESPFEVPKVTIFSNDDLEKVIEIIKRD